MKYQVVVEGRTFEIDLRPDGTVWVNGQPMPVNVDGLEGPFLSLLIGHRSFEGWAEATGEEYHAVVEGRAYRARLVTVRPTIPQVRRTGHREGSREPAQIVAPLPGLLVDVRVAEGEAVEAGTVVAVMESMKMNVELRAPRDGIVRSLRAHSGREVNQGEVLAVIE